MDDFDFRHIAPHCGGQREAFEELCCQLAHRSLPGDAKYIRLQGAGGDGGVECFADLPDGNRVGWQAKYVFDVHSLIRQATTSLTTALRIHSTLTRYVVCFPFDLTGPTGRRGRSGQEGFDDWRKEHESKAASEGRQLIIEAWPASKLRSLLLDLDTAGGMRAFFFNEIILTKDWFSSHLNSVKVIAGPRYTLELNVETDLWKWFAAFGRTAAWSHDFERKLRPCREAYDDLASAVRRTSSDATVPAWPDDSREHAQCLVTNMAKILDECNSLSKTDESRAHAHCIAQLGDLLEGLRSVESDLAEDLEAQHGPGSADSPGFRQFMAEYEVSFPTANLDHVRNAVTACRDLRDWLQSPAGSLAFARAFVLTGAAGSGKTHGICDAAHQRFGEGLLICVTFGHTFCSEPDPWTGLLGSLGLPIALGRDGLLDALNAAAEASGSLLILCIDALNETRPLRYWRNRLSAIVEAVQRRPCLRLCVTCRTSFVPYCLPVGVGMPVIEHQGFAGVERLACQAFFQHYNLKPPITPILQPEFSNPLYLKLVCETLRSRDLDRIPAGWRGLAPVIRAFLDEKERQFAADYETNVSANMVTGSLRAIARAVADSGGSSVPWSRAQQVISEARPQARDLPVVEWLVRADLLIEDAPGTSDPLGDEGTVRPAFERLGDFLVADEILSRIRPEEMDKACRPGQPLHSLLSDLNTIGENNGVVSALSVLLPEKRPGLELPNLVADESVRAEALKITVKSFPWRDPASLSSSSASLMLDGLGMRDFFSETINAALSVSWQPSTIDALWLDVLLKRRSLARRDAWWCGFLHQQYESGGTVRRLIDAAFELPLDQVDKEVAERWATVLLWFTAAADRRVKDTATRAATALLVARPEVIPDVLTRLLGSDDDEVRERTLLCCYGALIISRNADVIRVITNALHEAFRNEPAAFDNALIRDNIRCIAELARVLDALPDGCDPELTMQPIRSEWPLDLPPDEEVKRLDGLPRLAYSCLHDDFHRYSMGCLGDWEHAVPRQDMGKWILRRVAHGFGYEGSGCERYDGYMLGRYGGGRAKPTWAERIGKKYQWVAMYQLASRLWDHVERKPDSWVPKPQGTPLILLEGRKIDPTLPPDMVSSEGAVNAWWIGSSADLRSGEQLSHIEWVKKKDDLPTLEGLLAIQERNGRRWRLLVSYPSWTKRDEDAHWNDPYREVWVHVESYLIPRKNVATAYDCLHRRNFFGKWMTGGATWLHGFAGEYPWATPFNAEPEEWHRRGGRSGYELPVPYMSSWNGVIVEWEYDASLPGSFHMMVPARAFFSQRNLWWDGRDGYRLVGGKTIFRDPSVTEKGPVALIADADDLLGQLDKMRLGVIWTLLGEKWILGGRDAKVRPRRTFSQIARLMEDGSVQIGERVFFEDYDQDVGPRLPERKPRGTMRPRI